jgi:hypothetical protein
MNERFLTRVVGASLGFALLLGPMGAFATTDPHTYTFNFNTKLDVDHPAGNELDYTTGGLNGRTVFFGSNGSDTISATVSAWRVETDGTNTEVSEYLYKWSNGLGVKQADAERDPDYQSPSNPGPQDPYDYSYENEPWHSVDNNPNNCSAGSDTSWVCDSTPATTSKYTGEEFLVFDFGETDGEDNLVSMHSFLFGYAKEATDTAHVFDDHADATVLIGSNVDNLGDLENNAVTSAAAGFSLVSNYANVKQADLHGSHPTANAQEVQAGYSRYWAASTLLTSLANPHKFNFDWFDAAKLAQITVKTQKSDPQPPGGGGDVPVPATLSLLLLGGTMLRGRSKPSRQTAEIQN